MVRLTCTSYSDIALLSSDYSLGQEPRASQNHPNCFYIKITEAVAATILIRLLSEVWYSDLPHAINVMHGSQLEAQYHEIEKNMNHTLAIQAADKKELLAEPRLILEVGVEGGSISISLCEEKGRRTYLASTIDCSSALLDNKEEPFDNNCLSGNICLSWREAISSISHYEWWDFYPLFVDPEYSELVRFELRSKGIGALNPDWNHVLNINERKAV